MTRIDLIDKIQQRKNELHITIENLGKAVSKPQNYCYACFNGNYPVL